MNVIIDALRSRRVISKKWVSSHDPALDEPASVHLLPAVDGEMRIEDVQAATHDTGVMSHGNLWLAYQSGVRRYRAPRAGNQRAIRGRFRDRREAHED